MNIYVIVAAVIRIFIFLIVEAGCAASQIFPYEWDITGTYFVISMIIGYFLFRIVYYIRTKVPRKVHTLEQKAATIVTASIEGVTSCLFLLIIGCAVFPKSWMLLLLQLYFLLTSIFSFAKAYRTRV